MNCRHCGNALIHDLVDLGFAPPSNAYLTSEDLVKAEIYYPLKIKVCNECWLVQTEDYAKSGELFNADYAYFSSTTKSWLIHSEKYVEKITNQLKLNKDSFVIEVAANDGYLLKNFIQSNIPCLGIEPTDSTASVAEALGIDIIREFFDEQLGEKLAKTGKQADLIIGNNVYAHVPDINDFTRGLKAALKPNGTITLEFQHLMKIIEHTQFDTLYHEHFSYLSLYTVDRIFKMVGLRVWDVEELPTHCGSLRVYGCHADDSRATSANVTNLLKQEDERGIQKLTTYYNFQKKTDEIKDSLLVFLIEQKKHGKKVVAYGAAAKGSTLLNYAGVKPDLLSFVCDSAASKQGKFMPGSHIPIFPDAVLLEHRPDYVLILPWNICSELKQKNSNLEKFGTKFITVVPKLEII